MPAYMRDVGADSDSEYYAAIKKGIAATEREDYPTALKILHAVYHKRVTNVPTEGLSHYGLCLAIVEKKNKVAIDYCRTAIQAQFYDSAHYVNLIKIYLLAKSRRRAVEVLEQGLKRMPSDRALIAMREKMRYRAPSPVKFLHRDHFLNQVFGRLRYKKKLVRRLKIVAAILFFAVMFGGTFLFLLRQSGL